MKVCGRKIKNYWTLTKADLQTRLADSNFARKYDKNSQNLGFEGENFFQMAVLIFTRPTMIIRRH